MDTATNLNKNDGISINPDDFTNVQPIVKVGCIYPDLYSQATYLNKDMKNLNSQLLKNIEVLTQWELYGSVERIMDAIYNHIIQESESAKDRGEVTPGDIRDIASETFAYNQLAKGLLNILLTMDHIKDKKKCIEFTKHRILL